MEQTVDLEKARENVKASDVCPTCKKYLASEFVESEREPFKGRYFDGVICDDGKAYHHGCEQC